MYVAQELNTTNVIDLDVQINVFWNIKEPNTHKNLRIGRIWLSSLPEALRYERHHRYVLYTQLFQEYAVITQQDIW